MLDKQDGEAYSRLRIVPPNELNAEISTEDATPSESRGEPATPAANGAPEAYDLLGVDGTVIVKNNRLTIDDANRQGLSQQEIEELKKSSGGKEIIEKILANHAGLDEKTAFSKAKYTLRKTKKYLKRFTVMPMDLGNLIQWITEREAPRIMELREETLGLILAWSNVHYSKENDAEFNEHVVDATKPANGRWLVVDDTGGLIVAAMAEKMGLLYHSKHDYDGDQAENPNGAESGPIKMYDRDLEQTGETNQPNEQVGPPDREQLPSEEKSTPISHTDFPLPASTNTITLLHPAVQPNLSLLRYFGYDSNQPDPTHPLHTHLKPLSWLQILHPEDDTTYREPEQASEHTLRNWKSGKRGTYWKKRRRWQRCKAIVDETQAGGFEGLVIASNMDPKTTLSHLIPLVRGGGHVVIYSPTSEPLVQVMDLYSKERRSAYTRHLAKGEVPGVEDFLVDPRLLLAPTLQTSRVRDWQVLPGRTHPVMKGKGGAEGYLFTARRVLPLEGAVEARGNFTGKKRKAERPLTEVQAGAT